MNCVWCTEGSRVRFNLLEVYVWKIWRPPSIHFSILLHTCLSLAPSRLKCMHVGARLLPIPASVRSVSLLVHRHRRIEDQTEVAGKECCSYTSTWCTSGQRIFSVGLELYSASTAICAFAEKRGPSPLMAKLSILGTLLQIHVFSRTKRPSKGQARDFHGLCQVS